MTHRRTVLKLKNNKSGTKVPDFNLYERKGSMNLKSKQMKNALILIAFGIILMWALDNIEALWHIVLALLAVTSPFIIGISIAFVMYVPMRFFERKLFKKVPQKIKRPISYTITLLIFLFCIFITLFMVIPEFYNSIQELANRIPQAWDDFLSWMEATTITDNQYVENFINSIDFSWEEIEEQGMNILTNRGSDWLRSTFTVASSVVGTITSVVIGFVFSLYILFQKEKLVSQVRRISLALFPIKTHEKLVYLANLTNKVFSNFLSGQLFQAIILGGMFFIAMKIFNFPFALVISILVGITSFIPIIGAFIGGIIGTLLILVEDFQLAIWFVVMFLILQQIEGNVIYPNVAGKSVGLPSIWVLAAVTLGGSLMGILGIILFVPLATILYTLIKVFVNKRLREKNVSKEDIHGNGDGEALDKTGQ